MLNIPEVLKICHYEINTEEECKRSTAYLFSWSYHNQVHYISSCANHRELVEAHIASKSYVTQAMEVN